MLCSAGTNYTITKGFLHVRNISIINNTYNVNQHVFLPMKTKYMLLHTHSAIYSKYSHILFMASYLKLIFFSHFTCFGLFPTLFTRQKPQLLNFQIS